MERALYDPVDGYYVSTTDRPTRIRRLPDRAGAPSDLRSDAGRPGRRDVAAARRARGVRPSRIRCWIRSAVRVASSTASFEPARRSLTPSVTTRSTLPGNARSSWNASCRSGTPGSWCNQRARRHHDNNGVVIANEYVDALPVHRVIRLNGELREIHVDLARRCVRRGRGATDGRSPRDMVQRRGRGAGRRSARRGRTSRCSTGCARWPRTARARLRARDRLRGGGARAVRTCAAERHDPSVPGHTVSSDVLSGIGERDITSHVDFDALERQARASGLDSCRASPRATSSCSRAASTTRTQQARAEAEYRLGQLHDASLSGAAPASIPTRWAATWSTCWPRNAPIDPPLRGFSALLGTGEARRGSGAARVRFHSTCRPIPERDHSGADRH